jgi:ABC-type lipoprotein release transport system permease subunit
MSMARFGLRNLVRRKGRLVVITVLIGVPLFLLLVMQAIADAVQRHTEALKRSVDTALQLRARGSMGHVNMMGSDALLPGAVLEHVHQVRHVARIEPYLLAMTPTEGHNFAMIVGVNPGDTKRLESHGEAGNPTIIAGRDLRPEDHGQAVGVIGQGYARLAGITAGTLERATLALDLRRTHPAIYGLDRPSRTLRIVGIYASGYVFGDMQLFIPLDTFRDIYGMRDQVSWVFVTAESADQVPAVRRELTRRVGDVADIIAPETAAAFESTTTRAVVRLARGGVVLAAALVAAVVFFVMLLIVRERAWEIGTLKALGAPNGGIVMGLLTEAVAFCLLGGAVALLLFGVGGEPIVRPAFRLGIGPFLDARYKDTLVETLAWPGIGPAALAVLVLACVGVAAVGSAYAVRQILTLSPLEAMRRE